jgi:hypothetical protein
MEAVLSPSLCYMPCQSHPPSFSHDTIISNYLTPVTRAKSMECRIRTSIKGSLDVQHTHYSCDNTPLSHSDTSPFSISLP